MCTLITATIAFEKRATYNEEMEQMYIRILILSYVNIGVLLLLVNMDAFQDPDALFLGFLPILNGEFTDMDSDWYSKLGVTISFSLVLGIFTPHASYFFFAFLTMCLRRVDSGWRGLEDMSRAEEIKEAGGDPNDPNTIDVHTGKLIQDDLNALWTGEEIYSHYVYASVYSYLWVVLMYSTGLPVLYVCAFFFFMIFYWAYKWLLLKYYKRTEKFNQRLPIQATTNIPVGLVIHLCFGSLMISNSQMLASST
jgi:hypothetical protein